ncbi:class II aldolase/adducin family protein [Streptomyces sp. NEAU-YJ-81]|uniref:class II aldolase/adducin family protein n=1 Tax=Streptomyces sp. NEAU-YJ-81 TaxID=2820288 RepID=UPI001ABC42CF|nr:class II aldolase/adducin family protein [Streptomyces sp. NEAU-YJ-81]MBO3677220.1 class II aldolase/adducin family protein [Streptomyces sp. NEAU-YJ-81]
MSEPRDELARAGAHLAALGLSPGSSGNLSVRDGDTVLITPTGADLAAVDEASLSVIGLDGSHRAGPRPSKEFPLHLAFYRRDPDTAAVVHLHSRHATAVSCLPPWSEHSAVPPLTPYFVTRVGTTPLIPYADPGDPAQADAVARLSYPFRAALLENHGPITVGRSMSAAVAAAIELEEVSALLLLLGDRTPRLLPPDVVRSLARRYGSPWSG